MRIAQVRRGAEFSKRPSAPPRRNTEGRCWERLRKERQAALATRPERRHLEQTQICRTPVEVCALTRWRLGFHFFGEDLWEWLTLCPKTGPLAQIAQTFGMVGTLSSKVEPILYHKRPGEASRPAGRT